MLFGTDDDDIDFTGGGSSKLAGLFSNQAEVKNGNPSLKYTAPKQPKKTVLDCLFRENGTESCFEIVNITIAITLIMEEWRYWRMCFHGYDNPSVVYSVPYKNIEKEAQTASGSQTVLHAVAVTSYKYEGGKYISQGKVGAAILGSHNPPVYKIIIYKTKQQQLTAVAITSNFEFTIQPNNYANFYDDYSINWSVLFSGEQAACDFARQVALCKANSAGPSLTTTVIQDLTIGEGELLQNGDSIEVKYTGWILANYTFGEVFDTNENANKLLRLKLGKGKAIKGMEDGLLGAHKNGKRLLIIPPSLGYGNQAVGNKIPPNSTLIFEIFVNKVKFAKESRSSTPTVHEVDSGSDSRRKDSFIKSHSESVSNEDTIRARGASISEQLSQSPKTEKAKIISRMAKMGMSLLPVQSGTQPSSESETEDEMQSRAKGSPLFHHESTSQEHTSPKPVPKPRSGSNTTSIPQQQNLPASLPAQQQMAVLQPQQQFMSGNIYPFPYHSATTAPFNMLQQPFPNHAVATASPTVMTSVADSHFPILLAETRTQNTEVRLALGKITEKVDVVLHKLDDVKQQSGFSGQIPYLESSVLLQNIQRIVQENNKLKQEMEDKNGKIQVLNEKICDLLQRNQRFIEESNNMLEQRSDSLHSTSSQSHARLLTLEQERVKLTAELSETISKLSNLQMELTTRQHMEAELQSQLQLATSDVQRQKQETENLRLKAEEQENLISTLQSSIKEIRQQKRELENKIEGLEEISLDLKNAKGILEKNLMDKKQQLSNVHEEAEKEMEEMRHSHEKEIEMLRNKLLKQRTLPSSEQVSQLENDIENKWKKHSEQMIFEASEKYRKEIAELREQKEDIENKLKEVESNLERTRDSHRSENDRIYQLEEEIEQLKQWKNMYESLHKNSERMKKEYDVQVSQLTRQLRQGSGSFPADSVNFAAELKNAMNKLYRSLQGMFQLEDSYTGSTIRQLSLNAIREITFEILDSKQSTPATVDETDNATKAKDETEEEKKIECSTIERLENDAQIEGKTTVSPVELTSDTQTKEEQVASNITVESISHTQTENEAEESNVAEVLASDSQTPNVNESSNLDISSSETRIEDEMEEHTQNQSDKPNIDSTNNEKDISASESDTTQREQQSEISIDELNNLDSAPVSDLKETEGVSSTTDHTDEKTIPGKESSHLGEIQIDSSSEKATPESKKKDDLLDLAKTLHSTSPDNSDSGEDTSKQYLFFDTKSKSWKPQPPPPPLFDDDDEDEDDWLK